MQLVLDLHANRLTIDGTEARGHHRWETTALAVLIEGGHHALESACGLSTLQAALHSNGQLQPLNRKQISRIWDGLKAMFEHCGRLRQFETRFRHPLRGRTVGPWWWQRIDGDAIEIVRDPGTAIPSLQLPRLLVNGGAIEAARLCQEAMATQILLIEGRTDEAWNRAVGSAEWSDASPGMRVFRDLMLVEVHLRRRRFDVAHRLVADCRCALDRDAVYGPYLNLTLLLAEQRCHYFKSPVSASQAVLTRLAPWIGSPAGARYPEVDRSARGLMLNLSGLCRRRLFESACAARQPDEARHHLDHSVRYWHAALFALMTSGQYEGVQNVCANMAYALHRACQLGVVTDPAAALHWYFLAQFMQHRFDLADNNVWEMIYLGDFWLYVPGAREALKSADRAVVWAGKRPNDRAFYVHAMSRAHELGEPRQIAHAALNLWHFEREFGVRGAANSARRELDAVLRAQPDLLDLLIDEGYRLPGR